METLPAELILSISYYLNPIERFRVSYVSRRYRDILPVWFRIKLHSPSCHSSLNDNFYVSPADDIHNPLLLMKKNPDNTNMMMMTLKYDVEYVFWTFDYERSNRVYLGRHGQKLVNQEECQFLYTLGLQPKHPNQTWKITRTRETVEQQQQQQQQTSSVLVDDRRTSMVVPFGSPVCLTVGGSIDHPCRPDSTSRLYLSAQKLFEGTSFWYAFHDRELCIHEQLHIYPSSTYILEDQLHLPQRGRIQQQQQQQQQQQEEEGGDRPSSVLSEDTESSHKEETQTESGRQIISEHKIIIHAIPCIMDGCCSLYSPESLQEGKVDFDLRHFVMPFHFWIEDGMLTFHAFQSLPFMFSVPVLEEDMVESQKGPTEPLSVLLAKNSSRWWAIKHYFCTAADADEGRKFQMDTFLRNSKDHQDHVVTYEEEKKLVHITVKDGLVDKAVANIPHRKEDVWMFSMCS